jgi:hypothetical protein
VPRRRAMKLEDLEPLRTAYFDGFAIQLRVFNRLNLQPWVRRYIDRGPAPKGLQNSTQGFNPGILIINGSP